MDALRLRNTYSDASGHTATNTPDLFRTPKLTVAGPGQYWGGGPPGKPLGCCWLFCLLEVFVFMFWFSESSNPCLRFSFSCFGFPSHRASPRKKNMCTPRFFLLLLGCEISSICSPYLQSTSSIHAGFRDGFSSAGVENVTLSKNPPWVQIDSVNPH